MKIFKIVKLFALIIFFSSQISAQNKSLKTNEYIEFSRYGEVYFSFHLKTKQEVNSLSKIISIDNIIAGNGFTVFAYANKNELIKFKEHNINYEVLPHPGSLNKNPTMLDDITQRDINSWDYYPTYSAYVAMMYQFETDYPNLCKIVNLGQSIQGRDILYAKISDNVNTVEAEPRFDYTSTMHGDETVGYILMLRLIDYLLTNYNSDAQVTNLVNGMEIWINPLSNPDGTFHGGNNSVSGAVRYNANNIDLNRNYPDFVDGPHPDGNAWQPENILMMNLADSISFVMSANFHTGSEVLNYPWDTKPDLNADDNWWQYVTRQWADTTHTYGPAGYLTFLNDGITNGYAWYTINGGRQDYMNYYHHCKELTVELSNVKNPPANELPSFWDSNYRSLLNYINQALYGVRGIITDSITGAALEANVFISGHDIDNTDVYSILPFGDYYRLIYAGTYNITYSAPGYNSKTINGVSISNESATILDVQLSPALPVVNFSADITSSCTGVIEFTDQSSTTSGSTYLWDFGDSTISSEINPVHYYTSNGVFDVSLTVTNGLGSVTHTETALISINLPDSPVGIGDSICNSGIAILTASASGIINWYTDSLGGASIATGTTFTSPVLTSTTDYYAENVIEPATQSAAKPDNSGGGSYYTSNTAHYLVFDCFVPLTIKTVKVYANSSGSRLIQLRDNGGNVIASENIFISAGEQTITLNFDVPVGSDFELAGPPAPDLYRNNAGLNYPYELAGVLSVKHSSANSNPTGYYYYFYDWTVQEESCISARTKISAVVSNNSAIASFSYTQSLGTVEFTNTSSYGELYYWYFGDGNTSNEENPSHTYTASGIYTVSLNASNACGSSSDSETITILITISEQYDNIYTFNIYPNPANGIFNLQFSSHAVNHLDITIVDVLGNVVLSESINNFTGDLVKSFDLSSMPDALYLIKLSSEDYYASRKLLIER